MYIIRTMSMANFLIENGFVLRKIDRNSENRNKLIFLFDDTKTLRDTMSHYKR